MWQVLTSPLLAIAAGTTTASSQGIDVRAPEFSAHIRNGAVVELKAADGTSYVRAAREPGGATIHREETAHATAALEAHTELTSGQSAAASYGEFADLPGARLEARYALDTDTGDLVIEQRATGAAPGIWGVGCWLDEIPLDYAILVPGGSGLRLTRDTPGPAFQYDYPMTWEVQLVIIEGPAGGCCAWAEDPRGRYKRLVVERRATGWRIGLISINDAPFDALTSCESVRWRVSTYTGDWRVPARRYRDWWEATSQPVPVVQQQPAWVRDMRGCVITGLDLAILERLSTQFDPAQTMLYVYDWRAAGYDRDYPDYARMRPELLPYIARAHALGFRVMLHVNYFGVDPLHPAYAQFERYQVRSPWGAHDKEWWIWSLAEPEIRFAYINPACRAWRDFFTQAMVDLCRQTGADALHLDQTLCIFNDHNGRIDGLSMLEGNLALHRQLREALPQVALSGEGLNEITCRYEAFAQRHVWGLDHTKGTFDRRWLQAAHPISSYILRPFTVMYGYLGCAHPENDQVYAAWQEAYRHWGVIPTLKPTPENLAGTDGFARQFLDELHFWQRERVDLDLDAPWPPDIAFPWRTGDGRRVVATQDRRWICEGQEIFRTVTGVTQLAGAGTIPGWLACDADRLLGLRPQRWYPVFPGACAANGLHISAMPDDVVVDYVAVSERLAVVALEDAQSNVADFTTLLDRAVVGSRADGAPVQQQEGAGMLPDGSQFVDTGGVIHAHPPWKQGRTGEAFAQFECTLPTDGTVRFVSDVSLDAHAVGADKSDGVTFGVRAAAGAAQVSQQIHQDTAELQALALDLTPFRGKTIRLEMAVDAGPRRSPTYDWARWHRPRIERTSTRNCAITLGSDQPWEVAPDGAGAPPVARVEGTGVLPVVVPGATVLLRTSPAPVTLPADLTRNPDDVFFVLDSGLVVDHALHAHAARRTIDVQGAGRSVLSVHPPNNGRTLAVFLLTLPAEPARLVTSVGLRDGSKSEGVDVSVMVNGRTGAPRRIRPGVLEEIVVDLQPWAGRPVALCLVTNAAGSYFQDWVAWVTPRIIAR